MFHNRGLLPPVKLQHPKNYRSSVVSPLREIR